MKALILYIFLMVGTLGMPPLAGAEDPVDLVAMQEAGLDPETIGRYLAQNLDSTRLAPPIEAGLLSRLGAYGGDDLVKSYLNLDKQTAHLKQRDFSPQVVEQLLASDVGAEKLKSVLDGEAARAARAASAKPDSPALLPAPPQPSAVTESDLAPAPSLPPAPAKAASAPVAPAVRAPQSIAPALPQSSAPSTPQSLAPAAPQSSVPTLPQSAPPVAPQVAAPTVQALNPPQPRFQDLRPGQAADPASKVPPPLDTYELRRPADEPWMGVTERELADGHRVEVNRMGDPGAVGQEVITRPSGRRVYRYHSGNTGQPAPITDPAQEQRNREDLQIIYGGSK